MPEYEKVSSAVLPDVLQAQLNEHLRERMKRTADKGVFKALDMPNTAALFTNVWTMQFLVALCAELYENNQYLTRQVLNLNRLADHIEERR